MTPFLMAASELTRRKSIVCCEFALQLFDGDLEREGARDDRAGGRREREINCVCCFAGRRTATSSEKAMCGVGLIRGNMARADLTLTVVNDQAPSHTCKALKMPAL